jgi:sec-independent protein translocase protein TatC
LNLYLKTAFYGGMLLAAPFILYQIWLFISPGLYKHEKKYVFPFMLATVSLFLAGAWFGYHYVFPGALQILIFGFGKNFHPIITIDEYTGFFLAVNLGLGACFELPIVIFFLALFGIVDAGFLWRNCRYAILIIFVVAGIICPTPDPLSMCIFASPMLVLFFLSIGVAWFVHPNRRKAKEKAA